MRRNREAVCLLAVLAVVAGVALVRHPVGPVQARGASGTPAAPDTVRGFSLTAEYAAGFGIWHSWKLTLDASGRGEQIVYGRRETRKTVRISGISLQALEDAVRRQRFFALRNSYTYPATDLPTLVLKISQDGQSHAVSVYGPMKSNPEVRRFLTIWNEVLRATPPPNPDQKPFDL